MLPTNLYAIRPAGIDDEAVLRRLSQLDSKRTLAGPALIGEIDGGAVAAISLADGRVAADPFQRTEHLAAHLRLRAGNYRSYVQRPSLRDRIRAGLRPFVAASARS